MSSSLYGSEKAIVAPIIQKAYKLANPADIKELSIMVVYVLTHEDELVTALHLVKEVLQQRQQKFVVQTKPNNTLDGWTTQTLAIYLVKPPMAPSIPMASKQRYVFLLTHKLKLVYILNYQK